MQCVTVNCLIILFAFPAHVLCWICTKKSGSRNKGVLPHGAGLAEHGTLPEGISWEGMSCMPIKQLLVELEQLHLLIETEAAAARHAAANAAKASNRLVVPDAKHTIKLPDAIAAMTLSVPSERIVIQAAEGALKAQQHTATALSIAAKAVAVASAAGVRYQAEQVMQANQEAQSANEAATLLAGRTAEIRITATEFTIKHKEDEQKKAIELWPLAADANTTATDSAEWATAAAAGIHLTVLSVRSLVESCERACAPQHLDLLTQIPLHIISVRQFPRKAVISLLVGSGVILTVFGFRRCISSVGKEPLLAAHR
eukprot:gnl/MRDRNA2_/MRDRNA2_18378_c0_seq1.p1 gnl/MRDRNA2_/MRDRNA2_18378_c0~~gnl/MRDRNA2_/MRDRNA2_18378_c0_seq1.p1  ORF type:complete len:314 (-),score=43.85 gnl/MRDRNA2_/MRDRNA2_18378_c0_seq1:154-1095(-)